METIGHIPLIKKEDVSIPKPVSALIDSLQNFDAEFDERVLESIGRQVGFHSTDDKVQIPMIRFKLLACFAEKLDDNIVTNVNMTHRKEIDAISRKIAEAEADTSKPC